MGMGPAGLQTEEGGQTVQLARWILQQLLKDQYEQRLLRKPFEIPGELLRMKSALQVAGFCSRNCRKLRRLLKLRMQNRYQE